MAVQTIEQLKEAFGPGAILTKGKFSDIFDTVEDMVSHAGGGSGGGAQLTIPLGYHDWDGLNTFTYGSGGGYALPGDYYAVDIEALILYSQESIAEYEQQTGTEVDDSLFDNAELLAVENVDFRSYYSDSQGLYPVDGQGNTIYPPLFIKCGNVIVTIPYGQSALFARSVNSLGAVLYHGDDNYPIDAWRVVGTPVTATEADLAELRSGNSSSGS